MRYLQMLLCSLLLLSAIFASAPENVQEFAPHVASYGSYSIAEFPFNGNTAYAIVSGGEVYAVYSPSLFSHNLLMEISDIKPVLTEYFISAGYSPDSVSKLLPLHSTVVGVSGDRKAGEAKCRILTGTDRIYCDSFESCQKACYSVTSFCQPVALGSGRGFIEIVWAFENNTRALDAAYANELKAYNALNSDQSFGNAVAYVESINDINRAATLASESPLYDGYSYCFSPEYSLPKITAIYLSARNIQKSFEPFYLLDEYTSKVRARTLEGLQRKEEYEYSLRLNNSIAQKPSSAPGQVEKQETAPVSAGNDSLAVLPDEAGVGAAPGLPEGLVLAGVAFFVAIAAAVAFFFATKRKKKRRGL